MHSSSKARWQKDLGSLGTIHLHLLILEEFSNSVIVCFGFHRLVHANYCVPMLLSFICIYSLQFVLHSSNSTPPNIKRGIDLHRFGNEGGNEIFFLEREALD